MSYQNFKPDFWSKYIQGELGKLCVLHEDCDYTFEGEIKYGERIKILRKSAGFLRLSRHRPREVFQLHGG